MKALLLVIQTLALLLSIQRIYCQNGFNNQEIFRPQNMVSQDYQVGTITGYTTNVLQRDPSSQSVSSVNGQYTNDDIETEDVSSRAGRSRKVYRIKNPFQKPDETEKDPSVKDSDARASNQYAAMQYSLPPEEFLQQMRTEGQYYQQQSQGSTPAPSTGYSSTPQPQYQYSTINSPNYHNNNQQFNQVMQIDRKPSQAQPYYSNYNPYQYNNLASYTSDGVQSTPSPSYLSTPSNNQLVGTPANSYASSSSPVLLSSPPSLQQYVSSPSSVFQTGSSDYNIKSSTSPSSNSFTYENNDADKRMQIDHYDNSVNGMQYPTNLQQQYRNDFLQSTSIPLVSDSIRDNNWRQSTDVGVSDVSKPFQEVSFPQYWAANTQQENNYNINSGNVNFDSQRFGYPSANNMYLNFAQPDSQMLNTLKNYAKDLEQEIGRSEIYSHGDYGWKLQDKKSFNNRDEYSTIVPQHNLGLNSDNNRAVSQIGFHMDHSNSQNNYETPPKSENSEDQSFVKAAAKAHENMKRQQILYSNNNKDNYSPNYNLNPSSSFINNNKAINNLMTDLDSYSYNKGADIITVPPFNHLSNSKDNFDGYVKQPFDHAKALKNIVPIDVPNGVLNSDLKTLNNEGNKYSVTLNKDQTEQIRQYYKPVSDTFYKDKNTGYGINIKIKPDDSFLMNSEKQKDQSVLYNEKYTNLQSEPSPYNRYISNNNNNNNHYSDETPHNLNYVTMNTYQERPPAIGHIQQNSHHPQPQSISDVASILKFNDIPYRITQGTSLNNNHDQISIPTPIPPRINQSVGSHQTDVTNSILSKLLSAKQSALNINRPELGTQPNGLISTINGFRVANPYNVDLKLVAEMLKGKTSLDESHTRLLREQFNKPSPLKMDISYFQELFRNENDFTNLASSNIGFGINPYSDIYNIGRLPYQGVKYSRSQEEEENIPIASDSTNNHPIGAVVEQDDLISGREESTGTDVTDSDEDSITNNLTEDRPEVLGASPHRAISDRPRHPNSLFQGRYTPKRKYPKTKILEPYPLLKPPAPQLSRFRNNRNKYEHSNYRRRNNKRKMNRILKNTEPLFKANAFIEEDAEPKVPILLRPPVPEEKSDDNIDDSEES